MDWVSDIVKIEPSERTRRQWALIGEHHAQALVARRLPAMWPDEWGVYVTAILAAANHECLRLLPIPEGSYWLAYCRFLERIVRMEAPKRKLALRNVV